MGANQLFEIIVEQELAGERVLNVFHYRGVPLVDPEPADIAASFIEYVYPTWSLLVADDLFFVGVSVRELFSDDAPSFTPIGEAGGGGAADILPVFNAYSMTMQGGETTTRPGGKRFAAVPEGAQTDGVITNAPIIALLNDFGDLLSQDLTDPLTGLITWALPVIVKRIKEGLPEEYTYRMPETVGELVTNLIIDVVPRLLVGSQNSRKPY